MRQPKLLAWVLGTMLTLSAMAQEAEFKSSFYKVTLPPTITNYKNYSTFDVSATLHDNDESKINLNLPYEVVLPNLKKVENGGDFHLVYYLQKYAGKQIDRANTEVNVMIHLFVLDKYGDNVYYNGMSDEKLTVSYTELSKDDSKNPDVVNKLVLNKCMELVNKKFILALSGGEIRKTLRLAQLDGVKKMPELQEFEKQVKILKPALDKNPEEFVKAAEPFVSFWETMSNYSGEGKVEEVKRAAYNNLIIYYAAKQEKAKANALLALYKPIDKQVKEMFGLVKFMPNEECEKAMADFEKKEVVFTDAPIKELPIVTKSVALDMVKYVSIEGSFKITSRKEEGSYTGTLKISKLPAPPQGGLASLSASEPDVKVTVKDASGAEKTFVVGLGKVEDIKDNKGNVYLSQKFGTIGLGDGVTNVFMMSTYTSDKITVYRALIPATGDYVLKKKGDEKGVKSSMFNAKKTMIDYLSDCATLVEKLKNNTLDKKETVEKIAAMYTACN